MKCVYMNAIPKQVDTGNEGDQSLRPVQLYCLFEVPSLKIYWDTHETLHEPAPSP